MKITLFHYFIRQAMANILENRLVHLIGIGTMSIAFLIFYAFILIFVNINHWTETQGKTLTMSIYFKEEPKKAEIETIKKELFLFPGVTIKQFVSKDDAMKSLRRKLGEKAGLLDGFKQNPLPASLEITLSRDKDGDSLPYQLKTRLEEITVVDEVHYTQEWIKRFQVIMEAIKIVGMIFGGLLFLAALFIITNTIKLTIYSRKEEIEILKLVGATNRFVKIPFMIEGSIQGLLGGAVALFILFLAYIIAITRIDISIGFASLNIVFLSPQTILFLLLMSVIIGFIGSTISVGRFFRL
ncbi:MAG: ABC transporter permease [Deltaproteobacteria bacterium]|nr:ABC transporter permease [Deltaproteobacteria bacterium]MBW2334898.1 ABC transporter permease [Deltaproteobacteria bacterium]